LTSLVAEAVEEALRSEVVRPVVDTPVEKATVEKPPTATIDRFLSWTAELSEFDNLVVHESTEQSKVLAVLDDLVTWAAALRDRLSGNVNHGLHSDAPG